MILAWAHFVIVQKRYLIGFYRYFGITILIGLLIAIFLKFEFFKKFSLASFSDESASKSLDLVLHNMRKTPQFLSHVISSDSGTYASAYLPKPFIIFLNCFILFLFVKSIQYSPIMLRAMIVISFGLVVFLINYFHFIWGLTIFNVIHPRYFLPIIVVCFILFGLVSNPPPSKRSLNLISITASLLMLLSLHTTLRRWSVGLFEFQKEGTFEFNSNNQINNVWLNEESWREHFNDTVFLNSKWSPIVLGSQWMVLTLAVAGCFLLISSLHSTRPSSQDEFR